MSRSHCPRPRRPRERCANLVRTEFEGLRQSDLVRMGGPTRATARRLAATEAHLDDTVRAPDDGHFCPYGCCGLVDGTGQEIQDDFLIPDTEISLSAWAAYSAPDTRAHQQGQTFRLVPDPPTMPGLAALPTHDEEGHLLVHFFHNGVHTSSGRWF